MGYDSLNVGGHSGITHAGLKSRTQKNNNIAAIVCAYNEAGRICNVLRVLLSWDRFSEVVVVDDGSQDATADEVVRLSRRVTLIRHASNRGKGYAMETAVQAIAADCQVIFFCDADLSGLTLQTIENLVEPVLIGGKDMVVAQRSSPLYRIPYIVSLTPKLGGVRTVSRSLWDRVPSTYKRGFKIEAALNYFSKVGGTGFDHQIVAGLSQAIKERKYGIFIGFIARMKMCCEVFMTCIQLRLARRTNGELPQRALTTQADTLSCTTQVALFPNSLSEI